MGVADFDEEFDWVVIGCGAGALPSALVMYDVGKSTVILERSAYAGGTTAKSGGCLWVPNNPFMDAGEDSPELGMAYLNAVAGDAVDAPGTSDERRTAYVLEAPKMLSYLLSRGVELERASKFWPDYYDELPGGCKTSRVVTARPFDKNELGEWAPRLRKGFLEVPATLEEGRSLQYLRHSWKSRLNFVKIALRIAAAKLTGRHWVTAGAALQGRMLQAVLKTNAEIRLETPVDEIVMDGPRAAGVVTRRNGKPWRIGGRLGVLVNAGGFSQNQAMRDEYQPGTRAEWSNTIETDTGEMHLEMERVGGVLAQMDEFVGCQMTRAPGWEGEYVKPGVQPMTGKPHAILVDQSGRRYLNEGGSYELYCETMIRHDKDVPSVPSWAVFDSQFVRNYPVAGKAGARKPREWHDSGYLKTADTIEGLAALIGADPQVLRDTVDRWNGFVDKGVDEDFHRGERAYDKWLGDKYFTGGPNPTMGRIDQGPFYAVDVVPGDVGTFGGVVTDAKGRVLRHDGIPIEGLYATGVAAASMMGRVYPGAGASIGPAMAFGWIAARHAAGVNETAPS